MDQLVLSRLLRIKCVEAFLDAGVVNTQELVLSGGHVDKVRLALRPFFVQELVDRFV